MRGPLLTALIGLGLAPAAAASTLGAGAPDPSFGEDGTATVALGTWAGAAAVAVEPDGAIVTAGEADVNGKNVLVSTRMTPAGALDRSYGTGGIVTVPINGASGVDSDAGLALQADGKIVIAGSGRGPGGGPLSFAAVRLNRDGTLDRTFGQAGVSTVPIGSEAIANAVVIEPDGKIALGGVALADHDEFAAVRLNPDGALDRSFGTNGITTLGPTGGAWGMARQPDGRLVLVGQAAWGSAQQIMAARLLAGGTPDQSFGTGGIVTIPIGTTALGFGVALPGNGKILLSGPAFANAVVAAIVRLNSNGSLDSSYGRGGIATYVDPHGTNALELDPAGRLLLPASGQSVVRLNPDGTPDGSFGVDGSAMAPVGTGGAANGAAVQPDGKIVLAGATTIGGRVVITVTRVLGAPEAYESLMAHQDPAGRAASTSRPHHARRHHRRRHHHRRHHRHAARRRVTRSRSASR